MTDSLVTFAPDLAQSQLALVRLMQQSHDYIAEWRTLFRGGSVQAAERGKAQG